ncbi:hypothetical protein [Clostridium minihomine]|uniref:hypothetical protein n=1 Tax=Clostridium minihomine TaxID=2045012 RepID=UPI000C760AB1|nr:hypothetical protein [Clostridium minihomine]
MLIMLILLIGCVILIDYLPKRKLMAKSLRIFYLSSTSLCFVLLVIHILTPSVISIATFLTVAIKKLYGI